MSLDDDYEKFFDFSSGIKGMEVVEKVKNIVPSLDVAKENIIPTIEKKDSLYILKKEKTIEKTHGLGFCFELTTRKKIPFFNLIPFRAKHKKRSTEFISSFQDIDSYDFIELTKNFTAEDKLITIKALDFQGVNYSFIDEFNIENFRKVFISFQEFIGASKKYLFFEKKNQKSLLKKNLKPIVFKAGNPKLFFTLTESEDFYTLKGKLIIEGKTYQLDSSLVKVYPFFCKIKENIYFFDNLYNYIYINKFQNKGELNFQKKDFPQLYKEIIAPLTAHFEVKTTVYKKSKKKTIETNLKKQVYISDYEGEYVIFKLAVQYDEKLILLHSKEQLFDEKEQKIAPRNDAFENNFLEEFKDLHPDFEHQETVFTLTPYQLVENEWLLKASEKLKHKSITIFGANNLKSFKYNLNKPVVSMSVKSNIDWFDLEIVVKFGKEQVSLKEIRKALLNKSKYIQLSDGSLGILPEKWLKKLATYFKVGEVKNDSIKISNYQFNIIDELHDELETTPKFLIELQQKKLRLQNLETSISLKVPKNIKATLRPYQKQGLNWLGFLDENKLGGCLADDMGLGKTLQVITFLSHLKSKKKAKYPHLVIMPTSLIFNWQKEIEKFCSSLKTLSYIGSKRKDLLKHFSKHDIILSTYGSLLNDIEFLKDTKFGYVILDESQAIKNPNSKRYKAVRLLQSENRLALTGTPIENNTFDLYAQMNFLNPGILGAMSHFKKEFSEAIDKNKDEQASFLLGKIIHPFLLRRTKKQVAAELPEKTETILYCEMGVEQRKVYDTFKNKFRDYLLNKIDENGVAKSQMYVLEGLTKLRQICNSPELLNDDGDYGEASIKLDILIENIRSKTSDHKILVFSQFTSMLKLIKDRLEEYDIVYEYLDGKTRNREEKVQNFQENNKIRVFLISLKAGGVGLNLMAADYVFLVDPWWNPAVENQAIDRCYRIGQDKKVMAYKMICKDTIEEKITNLQNKKKQVSESIIQVDKIKKSFDAKQIKELFS
ncbi:MAG: SNF2 family helicase [Flavobacteriaceae bacterium]|nr:SNF2 family helicase [Flavobacteriaceae bacterium]